jgi:excisionase family DNA binding protein
MNQLENVPVDGQVQTLSNLLDIRGLCKYFKISEKTAYNLARERDFPSFKVNGKYRVIESDLAKWMDRKSKHRK